MGIFDLFRQKKKELPDYSDVTSYEKAIRKVQADELELIYLIPRLFDGSESLDNRSFLPPASAREKEKYELIIHDMAFMGGADRYCCEPHYKGSSLVPATLDITAVRNGHISFSVTMEIW